MTKLLVLMVVLAGVAHGQATPAPVATDQGGAGTPPAQGAKDGASSPGPVVRRVGGGVTPPAVLFAPEPQYSKEARKKKISGNVLVYLQVDKTGAPMNVRVLRPAGYGLDEKAVEAVKQYKFRPAMEAGHPVIVEMNVEVNFQIFTKPK